MTQKYQISNTTNIKFPKTRKNYWKLVVLEIGSIGNSLRGQEGFTLLEVLVSLSIIISIGVIVGSIIVSTLRGSTKATVLSDVKQNGDYALSEMTRVIRSATSADLLPCVPSKTAKSITVTQLDTSTTTFDCSSDVTITEQQGTNPVASLLDPTSTLVPASCVITCRQQTSADVPTIQVDFSLEQKNTSANFAEQTATVPFQTTISLRNIQQ